MGKKKKVDWRNIVTFGIYGLVVKSKAKRQLENINTELKLSDKRINEIDELIKFLGGKENIVSVDSSVYSLKLTFNDVEKIDIENVKKLLNVVGCLTSNNKITLNIGDNAATVASQIKTFIEN